MILKVRVKWDLDKTELSVYEDEALLVTIPYEKHWPPCESCIVGRAWCTKVIFGSNDYDNTFKDLICEKAPSSYRPSVPGDILGRYFRGKLIKKQNHENLLSDYAAKRKEKGDGERASDPTEQWS